MSLKLNELRLEVERMEYDQKEHGIMFDIVRDKNLEAESELEELKKTINDLKAAQKDASAEDKEKRKQEKMALMMAKFDAVCVDSFTASALESECLCSKGPLPRRMNNSGKCSPSLMQSTLTPLWRS